MIQARKAGRAVPSAPLEFTISVQSCHVPNRSGALGTARPAFRVSGLKIFRLIAPVLLLLISTHFSAAAAAEEKITAATLKISGYGILGNFQLKRILRTLELSGKRPQYFGPAFIEDSALILGSRVKKDGYLKPEIKIRLELHDGTHMETTADELLDKPLRRSMLATRAEFKIHKGVLYHYQELDFEGLKTMTDKEAKSYFMDTTTLLHPKSARVYTSS